MRGIKENIKNKSKQYQYGEMVLAFLLLLLVLLPAAAFSASGQAGDTVTPKPLPQDCDYLIENVRIVDGGGNQSYLGDIAIKGDTIAAVGNLQGIMAKETIDGAGKIVTPGFIDLHTHTEEYWGESPVGGPALLQGITTELAGNCGTSVDDVGTYLDKLEEQGTAINIGMLTGYKVLRRQVGASGTTTPEQVQQMAQLLRQSIDQGSLGFSAGLGYPPQTNATTEELIVLAKAVKEKNAFYALHIRNEGNQVLESVVEAVTIAKASGVRFQYNHVKAAGQANWNKMPQILARLDQAVTEGVDIRSDCYGYTFSSNDHGGQASMKEENVRMALTDPNVMIASDGGLYSGGRANYPRAYANAARILQTYVKEEQVLSLEQAVAKMTWQPAQRIGIKDRGLLLPGKKADLNLFVLEDVKERATREQPMRYSQGMDMVFVNGVPAVRNGSLTGSKTGEALRSTAYTSKNN